jgi:hypothetical protein
MVRLKNMKGMRFDRLLVTDFAFTKPAHSRRSRSIGKSRARVELS